MPQGAHVSFTLLVPRTFWDGDTEEAAITLELAVPLLEEAAGSHVEGLIGDTDPFVAVTGALEQGEYDEIICRRSRRACRTGCASTSPRGCSASDCR